MIWDSHPLALGATPVQVFVDGIPQLWESVIVPKPQSFQNAPKVPNFDDEAKKAVEYEGLPDLSINKDPVEANAIFTNVNSMHVIQDGKVHQLFSLQEAAENAIVIVRRGSVVCYGSQDACATYIDDSEDNVIVDLEGGSITPGFVSYGCGLGLEDIILEPSTTDGLLFDPLNKDPPRVVGGSTSLIRAVDGLQFGTRHALQAYRAGVSQYLWHLFFLSDDCLNFCDHDAGYHGCHFALGWKLPQRFGSVLQSGCWKQAR